MDCLISTLLNPSQGINIQAITRSRELPIVLQQIQRASNPDQELKNRLRLPLLNLCREQREFPKSVKSKNEIK
jgi:hypothetical protein